MSLAISLTVRGGKRFATRKSNVRVRDAYVVVQVVTDVSEDRRLFPGTSHPSTQPCIPENFNPKKHRCVSLKYHRSYSVVETL